ncbi:MAG: hypothetical protein MJ200_02385 [Mycoplasmoidaceae bacterium]|nr:hypothetical protein [Mycoplasmoidaceae bacterium]
MNALLPQPNTNAMAKIEALITETALFMGFSSYYLSLVDNIFNVKLKEQLHATYEGEITENAKVVLEGLVLLPPSDEHIKLQEAYLL